MGYVADELLQPGAAIDGWLDLRHSATLDRIGDRWSILILREAYKGLEQIRRVAGEFGCRTEHPLPSFAAAL
jgi:hypothetical protein